MDEDQRFLCIVKDGKRVHLSPEQLFDASGYDELRAATYVSSAAFFSKTVRRFQKACVIIGIEDLDHLTNLAQRLSKYLTDIPERVAFWNDLDDETKQKLLENEFQIRYCCKHPVHSKLYLLRNTVSGDSRVIIGSANLTESAFGNRRQYEELIVSDDPALYKIYSERFEEIVSDTLDYIPEACRTKAKEEKVLIVPMYQGDAALDVFLAEDQNRMKIVVTEEELSEIKGFGELAPLVREKIDVSSKTLEIMKLVTTKKNGTHVFKSSAELKKNARPIRALISRAFVDMDQDPRPFYQFVDERDSIYRSNEGNALEPYAIEAPPSDIRKNLAAILRFVDAYTLFTSNPSPIHASKIFEILLYTFTSPYLWLMRRDHVLQKGREGARSDISPFLVVAGRGKCGKTTAIEFIGNLIGCHASPYLSFQRMDNAKALLDYFNTENLCPVLVDEVPQSFFSSRAAHAGERFVKHVANDTSGKHPALIGITNASEFNVPDQMLRRIYYIEVSSVFDLGHYKEECSRYLDDVMTDIDDSLFRDFLYRLGNKVRQGEEYYGIEDWLCAGREIFKQYFAECGIETPVWFPDKMFADYGARGRQLWRQLYLNKPDLFREKDANGTLFVDPALWKNEKERLNYINFLDPICIKDDNPILILDIARFLEFIAYHRRESIWARLRGFLQKANHGASTRIGGGV